MVTWLKDGVPLEDKSVGIRTTDVDTIFFIRSTERAHSGTYTLSVQIENMCDSADIEIRVVGQSHAVPLHVLPLEIRTWCAVHTSHAAVNNLF